MAALFVLDTVTGDDTVFVPGYVLGPLIVALAAGPRPTAAVGLVATALGFVGLLQDGDFEGQDVIRIVTVAAGSALAVWIAVLRTRLQRANTELGEAVGLLDIVFAHAPVGIALLDRDLRLLRVNDRLAEIAGARGDTLEELLPDLPATVREDAARVVRTGTSLSEVEISGAERDWIASYWPVRRDGETIGVGLVLADVTERRAARVALREQTDRYEALLHALSDAGEGLVVLELDGRCVFANAAFEQLSGYTFPELAAMDSMLDLVGEYEQDEVRTRVLARIEEGVVQPGQPLTLRRRDGEWVDLEIGGTSLDVEGRRQLVVVVRDVTARRRAEAERERLLARAALLAEASELFDRSLDEELTLRRVAQLCVRDMAATCVIVLGDAPERRARRRRRSPRGRARGRADGRAAARPARRADRGRHARSARARGGDAARAGHGTLRDRAPARPGARPRRARRRLRRPQRQQRRGGARPVRGPGAPRGARDRQRAALRRARPGGAHAPALAAAGRAAGHPRRRAGRPLRGGRRGQRGRRRLLRLLRRPAAATGRWSSATSAARAPRRRA